jgi:hypothetical protein
MPEEIRRKSFVVSFAAAEVDMNWTMEAIQLVGVRPDRLLLLGDGEWLFAVNLYQWDPIPFDMQEPVGLTALRRQAVLQLKLDAAAPYRFTVMKRTGHWAVRRIENLPELFEMWRSEYKGFAWELIEAPSGYFTTIRYFNEVRLFLAPHGAGCVSLLWMQPRTVFCEIHPDSALYASFYNMSRCLRLHHVIYRMPGYHHTGLGKNLTVDAAGRIVDCAMKALNESVLARPSATVSPTPFASPSGTPTVAPHETRRFGWWGARRGAAACGLATAPSPVVRVHAR